MKKCRDIYEKPKEIFRKKGGMLRTSEALRSGIHPRVLYAMLDTGIIEKLSRGVYRLSDLPPLGNPDLVSVAIRVPEGVICLISALSLHDITSQIPHLVYLAIRRGSREPKVVHPPVRIFKFSGDSFTEGIMTTKIDDVQLRVYNPEKTVVDCFKHRNKIGIDVSLEALKLYRQRKRLKVDELVRYARICRVEKVMRPYLEALL